MFSHYSNSKKDFEKKLFFVWLVTEKQFLKDQSWGVKTQRLSVRSKLLSFFIW